MGDLIQHAEVTLHVSYKVDEYGTPEQKKRKLLRDIRLDMDGRVNIQPPLKRENVTLTSSHPSGDD